MSENTALDSRDYADVLKLEVSELSPNTESHYKTYISALKKSTNKKFGIYFGPDTLKNVEHLEERVVTFVDKDTFSEYLRILSGGDVVGNMDSIEGVHTVKAMGDIISLHFQRGATSIAKKKIDSLVKRKDIPEETARGMYDQAIFRNNLAHDVVHAYQSDGLPRPFIECGAEYYKQILVREVQDTVITSPIDDERVDFYKMLVEKYGDNIHKIFFGISKDERLIRKIEKHFNSRALKKLFPDGYGLTKSEVEQFSK